MMYVYIFLALLFSVHGGVTKYVDEKEPKCEDENAVYKPVTSFCEPTCEDWNSGFPCIDLPMPGRCVCKDGFVFNENNECVKPEHCPEPKCEDENAVYKPVTSYCEPTCDDWNMSLVCIDLGMPGRCVCKDGFVFNENNECVKPENCPAGCGGDLNAEFSICPPLDICVRTCSSPPIMLCPPACAKPGCVCKPGFVFENGKCIKLSECPAP